MPQATARFRELIKRPEIIVAPVCYDALTARIAKRVGFDAIALGGYAMGAHLATSEPLLTLDEVVRIARYITAAVDLPLMVDAGTGWGEPVHILRTVRELERAGVAGIHIEDQIFPKRVHYHKGVEHTVSTDEMLMRLRAAILARTDPNLVIVARTDAMRTHGYEEGVLRANLYAEAGADMVMLFPNNLEECRRAPQDCKAPLIYVNSEGNRLGRPVLSSQELGVMGYKMVADAISAINVAFRAVRETFTRLKETGRTGLDQSEMVPNRKEIEDTIGLDEYYRLEEETVEGR